MVRVRSCGVCIECGRYRQIVCRSVCSSCYSRHHRAGTYRDGLPPKSIGTSLILPCAQCGKPTKKFTSRINSYKKSYCSAECRAKSTSIARVAICDQCGKIIQRVPSQNRRPNSYCSKLCSDAAIRIYDTPEAKKEAANIRQYKIRYGPYWQGMMTLTKIEKKINHEKRKA